ncbi:hypothetical protein H2201_002186 [Coniosporium apollinis]|uniref:Sfi1 spindle body domain-containing protein n=2 Tax=Coniosporium TaxID=2810619 RepID=A0ABQ9NZ52_9PEZI|nr:hypothetical protein H2199_005620 [Cladosporium sp. JES 115]KAJ9667651.1 hypothetical protein H2201_002186 [Coniosporium apollinis]
MPATTADEFPALTDQDIHTLFQIINAAQQSSQTGSRALFTAYDETLARYGINPNHDRIYFRFLLRMGAGRPGEDLFNRFKHFLADLGISVELDEGGDAVDEITRQIDGLELTANGARSDGRRSQRASRRASFNSAYLDNGEPTWRSEEETDVSPPARKLPNGTHKRASSRASDPTGRRSRSYNARPRPLEHLPIRGRVTARASSETLNHVRKRAGSVSSQGSLIITRPHSRNQPHSRPYALQLDGYSNPSSPQASTSEYISGAEPDHFIPPELLYRPSETQMIADAEIFQYNHSRALSRRVLAHWRERALHLKQIHDEWDARATSIDHRTILHDAFTAWRQRFHDIRNERAAEEWVAQKSPYAVMLRDMFLKDKMFSHWAKHTEDKIVDTKVARRHLLRTKYLRAWRDVTAVNELKVERFKLKKWFGVWKGRTAQHLDDEELALERYEERLVQRVYWKWFWAYLERGASVYEERKIKARHLGKLIEAVRTSRETEDMLEELRVKHVESVTMAWWASRTRALQGLEPIADDFRRKAMLAAPLKTLRTYAQLAPLARQVMRAVGTRLMRTALLSWQSRARSQRQAKEVNRMRVLRNAWTTWNDRLRCQALSARIDDRVVLQSLYKWVLASRTALFIRVRDANLKAKVLYNLFNKTNEQRIKLAAAERAFRSDQRIRCLHGALACWRNRVQALRQQEGLALSLYEPRLLQRTFHTWHQRYAHISELTTQASQAQFYVLTTHALKKWRDATSHAQRLRRREAYATVRRKVKMGTCRRALEALRIKAAEVAGMNRVAQNHAESKTLIVAVRLFDVWRQKTVSMTEHAQQAETLHALKLRTQTFRAWRQRHVRYQQDEARATAFAAEITAPDAVSALRKLSWRLFQIQRQEETALALRNKHWERHIRGMLRYWAEQTAAIQEARNEAGAQTQRTHHTPVADLFTQTQTREVDEADELASNPDHDHDPDPNEEDEDDDDDKLLARASEWTAFDASGLNLDTLNLDLDLNTDLLAGGPGLPAITTSTPLPGYLRTPGKRSTARQKVRERLGALAAAPAAGAGYGGVATPAHAAAPRALRAATAPPAAGTTRPAAAAGAITPFERKLRAQGYGARGSGRGGGSGRRGFGASVGAGVGRERGFVVGFEDIAEGGSGDLEG